jgi:sortase B
MALTTRAKSGIALALAYLLALALACLLAGTAGLAQRGGAQQPSPGEERVTDADGFPDVDWGHWRKVNPDVIGWLTVPGTGIDLPVVQAHAEEPQFYLDHDVTGRWNFTGCPYLDASCAEGGLLGSDNAVVFGHNMDMEPEMFGELDGFADEGWAQEHGLVLLQTPEAKVVMKAVAADIVPGWEALKRTEFSSEADFLEWWGQRFQDADVKLADAAGRGRIVTLVTCSYNYWSENERTLVYCKPVLSAERSS